MERYDFSKAYAKREEAPRETQNISRSHCGDVHNISPRQSKHHYLFTAGDYNITTVISWLLFPPAADLGKVVVISAKDFLSH